MERRSNLRLMPGPIPSQPDAQPESTSFRREGTWQRFLKRLRELRPARRPVKRKSFYTAVEMSSNARAADFGSAFGAWATLVRLGARSSVICLCGFVLLLAYHRSGLPFLGVDTVLLRDTDQLRSSSIPNALADHVLSEIAPHENYSSNQRTATEAAEREFTHRVRIGDSQLNDSQFTAAAITFQQALSIDPSSVQARASLAYALERSGQLRPAIAEYQKIVEQNPTHAVIHNNLGYCFHLLGEFESAEQALKRALALDPAMIRSLTNLAEVFVSMGEPEKALPYQRAAAIYSADYRAHQRLGELLALAGRVAESKKEILLAQKLKRERKTKTNG